MVGLVSRHAVKLLTSLSGGHVSLPSFKCFCQKSTKTRTPTALPHPVSVQPLTECIDGSSKKDCAVCVWYILFSSSGSACACPARTKASDASTGAETVYFQPDSAADSTARPMAGDLWRHDVMDFIHYVELPCDPYII